MIIYYSGGHTELTSMPEQILERANVMTTYHDIAKRESEGLPERFRRIFAQHVNRKKQEPPE